MIEENTKILTVYDGPVSINDIQENTLIYSWDNTHKLPVMDEVYDIVKVQAPTEFKVLGILFDSGLYFLVSLEQIFYTFRGNKEIADDLDINQAIRAYTVELHKRDGHLRVFGYSEGKVKHQYVARMVWEYYNGKIEDDLILHHKDFDKLNNNINNFELLTNSWHNVVHYPHRKDGGFFKRGRNHKITSIDSIKLEGSLFTFKTKKNGAFIVPDDVPVHGLYTGIVLGV